METKMKFQKKMKISKKIKLKSKMKIVKKLLNQSKKNQNQKIQMKQNQKVKIRKIKSLLMILLISNTIEKLLQIQNLEKSGKKKIKLVLSVKKKKKSA